MAKMLSFFLGVGEPEFEHPEWCPTCQRGTVLTAPVYMFDAHGARRAGSWRSCPVCDLDDD